MPSVQEEIPLEIDKMEFNESFESTKQLTAKYYPKLYLRLKTHRYATEIIKNISENISKLYNIPYFTGISIKSNDGDLTGKITWNGFKETYIL